MDLAEAREIQYEVMRRANSKSGVSRYVPHVPTEKQREFLPLADLEAMFGGAAGGGKSDALLMAALQYVDVPDYAALLLRRSYADLSRPGALMDRAREWLYGTDARWSGIEKKWTFPSGATVSFGYLEKVDDELQYQGAEFQFVGFDELTQFKQKQYTYLLSRLRRHTNSSVPIRARSASNPGGPGHRWVYGRFVDPVTNDGRKFIPAKLGDNPHLDQVEYRKTLAQLDATTRAQLEDGQWIQDSQGRLYKFEALRNLARELPRTKSGWLYLLGLDLGASQNKPSTAFVVVMFSFDRPEVYVLQSECHAGMIPSTIAEHIRKLQRQYPFVQIVADEGALGKGYGEEFRQRYGLPVEPAQKTNKLGYRKLINGDFERAQLLVLVAQNAGLIDELLAVEWNADGDDSVEGQPTHYTDALLYAWRTAKHWAWEPTEERPKPGTPEHDVAQAEELERQADDESNAEERAWWER